MTIKELKGNKEYQFYCEITKSKVLKEIADTDYFDEWGCTVSLGETMVVEYNLCIDNTTDNNVDSSAIYKVTYNAQSDEYETDCSGFISYEIDFDNPKWKRKLENAMCKALIMFCKL